MTIILVGLNHETAPVELREKLTLTGCALPMALEELQKDRASIEEGVILSTCNRLEIVAVAKHPDSGWHQVESFLAGLQNIPLEELHPHLYCLEGTEAINHLMRVACGLNSMILGEPQILGQVTQAFDDAQSAALTGPILSRLFSQAIHTGKRARTETDISRFTTSVSHAGALLVLEHLPSTESNILILGAGEMAILAAKSLQKYGITSIRFINRTFSRATVLAEEIGGTPLGWHQLGEALLWADAVITATGAPHIVIYASDVEEVLSKRGERPLMFVDVAVPRDVDVALDALPGVKRFDIDDLQYVVDTNTAQRATAIPQVEDIIAHETNAFLEWYHSREVTPVIRDLRKWATEVAQEEVAEAVSKLKDADKHTADILNRLAHRLVNKLLHEPTVRLRGQAAEGNGHGYAHAVSELFGLHSVQCEMRLSSCENGEQATASVPCNLQCITSAPNGAQTHEH